jgi:hypothetical protein
VKRTAVTRLSVGALAAAAIAAIAYRQTHPGPLDPDLAKSVAELENRIDDTRKYPHNPATARFHELLVRIEPLGVRAVDGYSLRERLIMRLRAVRQAGLGPEASVVLEGQLEQVSLHADLEDL